MTPFPINILLGLVSLFDAVVFWFIGWAVATGNLAQPVPRGLSAEEKAKRDYRSRRGGTALRKAAPAMAVLGLVVMAIPSQSLTMVWVYMAGMLTIVGWILYYTLAGYWTDPGDGDDVPKSGSDRDLPIR